MATVFNGTYECPNGFKEEEVEAQLFHEDLDEDSELWLIRMPPDVELSALDKQKIFLSGNSHPACFKAESGEALECYVDTNEIADICLVLPQQRDKKLHEVQKVFQGSILVTQGLSQSDCVLIETEINKELPGNIVNENENTTTGKSKKKKKKSRTQNSALGYETEEAENVDYNSQIERFSTKEKKKSRTQNSVLGYETEEADNADYNSQIERFSTKEKKKSRTQNSALGYRAEEAESVDYNSQTNLFLQIPTRRKMKDEPL